jgi:spermidine synthase
LKAPAALPQATLSEHDGVRFLHLGTPWVQGAMRLKAPEAIELVYVQRMLAALLWLDPDALAGAHAVQLGLGAGSITRFTLKPLRMQTTAVEINPEVAQINHAFFRLPPRHERLAIEIADAGAWLRTTALRGEVMLLHIDLYDQEAAAPVLDDAGFYADAHALLAEGGVMAVNLFGRHASFERSIERIAASFGRARVVSLQPTREGNTIVIAARGPVPPPALLAERAATIEARFGALGLAARKWLRMVRPAAAPAPR